MVNTWTNATLTGNANTNADLRTGLFIIPTNTATYIYSILNGTYVETIQTNHEIVFSDIDASIYYVDKTTNQYALRHATYQNPVPNCRVFLAGVWKCGECQPGILLNQNNSLATQCTGLSLEGLLPVSSYVAEVATTMNNRAEITLNNLSNLTSFQK